ncbi:unnamed protein product [Discosporangium mesarthrocarpum]
MVEGRKLPAVKMFVSMLDQATCPLGLTRVDEAGLVYRGLDFSRVWIQGVVVEVTVQYDGAHFLVDDGTGTIEAYRGAPSGGNAEDPIVMDEPEGAQVEVAGSGGSWIPRKGEYCIIVGPPQASQASRASCFRYKVFCDIFKELDFPGQDMLWSLEVLDFWKSRQRSSPHTPSGGQGD